MPLAGFPQHRLKYLVDGGKEYVCVFEHNIEDGYFSEGEEEYIDRRLRFSILRLIGEEDKIRGKYEFKMEYPDIDKQIEWRQSKRPQDATDSELGEVDILRDDFSDNEMRFSGLRKSTDQSSAFLDGSSRNWHYAIGQYKPWNMGTIAGPWGEQYHVIKAVRLWMRLPSQNGRADTIIWLSKSIVVLCFCCQL